MRLEGGLGSRTSNGSGDAGANHVSPTAGYELETSIERTNSDQWRPTASSQPRSELEELRYRLAEQEEQLAWMHEQLTLASAKSPAPAEQQGGRELTAYQPKSTDVSLETGKRRVSHPALDAPDLTPDLYER